MNLELMEQIEANRNKQLKMDLAELVNQKSAQKKPVQVKKSREPVKFSDFYDGCLLFTVGTIMLVFAVIFSKWL